MLAYVPRNVSPPLEVDNDYVDVLHAFHDAEDLSALLDAALAGTLPLTEETPEFFASKYQVRVLCVGGQTGGGSVCVPAGACVCLRVPVGKRWFYVSNKDCVTNEGGADS